MKQIRNQLRIAAVVPVYNTDLYLKECLDSIFSQTYQSFDILVVNDGSTDKSKDILECYQSRDSRLQLFNTSKNGGVSRARNVALEIIEKKGIYDFICFIDSDDLVTNDYFESIVRNFTSYKSDCLIVGYKSFDKKQQHLPDRSQEIRPFELDQENAFKFCFGLGPFSQKEFNSISLSLWNMTFKAETIKGIRFNENLKTAEDQDYILKCIGRSNQLTVDNNIYYSYRIRKSSLTNSNRIRMSDIDAFLYWIIKPCDMSIACRKTVEHLAFQNFWRVIREAEKENKLSSLWDDLTTRLRIMENTFITDVLNSRKSKKRISIFNLGIFAVSLYLKITQNKPINDQINRFD